MSVQVLLSVVVLLQTPCHVRIKDIEYIEIITVQFVTNSYINRINTIHSLSVYCQMVLQWFFVTILSHSYL